LGRPEEAQHAARRASELYDRLAKQKPDIFVPEFARSLGELASVLWETDRSEAVNALRTGIGALRNNFLRQPEASADLMADLLNDYEGTCGELGREPDPDLVTPIIQALERITTEE
jgi:hypothetical protein